MFKLTLITGWWFVFFVYLSIYSEFHNPDWRTHIFQKGWYTTRSSINRWLILIGNFHHPTNMFQYHPVSIIYPQKMLEYAVASPGFGSTGERALDTEADPDRLGNAYRHQRCFSLDTMFIVGIQIGFWWYIWWDQPFYILWPTWYDLCFFPTSLCGVLVFGSAHPPARSRSRPPPTHNLLTHNLSLAHSYNLSPHNLLTCNLLTHNLSTHNLLTHTQLTHTQLAHSHNLSPHNLLTHNLLTHNLSTHNLLTHTTYSHTQFAHTTCSHTSCPHTTYSHTTSQHTTCSLTQLVTTQLAHTQLTHIQLFHTHTQLTPTQLLNTQLAHSHNLSPHNLLTHNLLTHNLSTHNLLTHTTYSHTQFAHTQLAHTQVAHAQLTHTQLLNTQLVTTQLAYRPRSSSHPTACPLQAAPLKVQRQATFDATPHCAAEHCETCPWKPRGDLVPRSELIVCLFTTPVYIDI